ncbi:MAG TPA: hypothetical protein VNN55_05065 [bacterium]|nr:hypothetical protein [bacterium]
MKRAWILLALAALWPAVGNAGGARGHLQTGDLPTYLRDRGEGIPTSMFGTYVQKGQLLVYPFVEHYRNANEEYAPNELGGTEDVDYRGDYEANEQLLFLAYGISDRLAIEMEGAIMQAELERSREDASPLPTEITESGLGDVEGQLRFRWARETAGRPEVFSYFETVFPTQNETSLIGTSDWEFKLGTGLTRGFGFGTMTVRGAFEYNRAEDLIEVGELAVEYLKRLSPNFRVYTGVEGVQDEWEFISELQWHVAGNLFFKFNNAFGVTSKAADWAPEMGIMFGL